jgi:hypothetical protein
MNHRGQHTTPRTSGVSDLPATSACHVSHCPFGVELDVDRSPVRGQSQSSRDIIFLTFLVARALGL